MHPDDGKCITSCTPRQYPGVGVGCGVGVGVGVGVGTAVQLTVTLLLPVVLLLAVSHQVTVSVQPPGFWAPGDESIGLVVPMGGEPQRPRPLRAGTRGLVGRLTASAGERPAKLVPRSRARPWSSCWRSGESSGGRILADLGERRGGGRPVRWGRPEPSLVMGFACRSHPLSAAHSRQVRRGIPSPGLLSPGRSHRMAILMRS